jgi:hypothetical protein
VCKKGYLRRIKWKDGFFWGCTRFRDGCKGAAEDVEGKPVFGAPRAKGQASSASPVDPTSGSRTAPRAAPGWGNAPRNASESTSPLPPPPPMEDDFLPGLF